MKIHSKFKDYYDTALHYGADTNIHYVRKTESVSILEVKWKLPEGVPQIVPPGELGIGDWGYQLVGFCGTTYPMLMVTKRVEEWGTYPFYSTHRLYGPEECEEFAEIFLRRSHYSMEFGSRHKTEEEKLNWIKGLLAQRFVDDRPFVELKTPVFHVKYDPYEEGMTGRRQFNLIVEKNPCLKDLSFFKVKDAFTAFQELAGYLGNQLVDCKEPDQIDDKYRIAQHGFDKWSFRKHKDQKFVK